MNWGGMLQMPMTQVKALLDMPVAIVTLLGVPTAIVVYWNQKRWERRQRELEAHSASHQRYVQYLYQPSSVQESQWLGWLQYLKWWFRRPDFAQAWPTPSQQFHREFVDLGDRLLRGADPEAVLLRTAKRRLW